MTMCIRAFVVTIVVLCGIWNLARGTGSLYDPPSRPVMWKYGYPTEKNYDYMLLNCGGEKQPETGPLQCGVCGDYVNGTRDHELGGKYGTGIIGRYYPPGIKEFHVKVELNSFESGFFEFRMCPANDKPVTQQCLDDYLLPIQQGYVNGTPFRFYPKNAGDFRLTIAVPPNLTCDRCVLQWRYHTGNSWGTDPETGEAGTGLGNQKDFYNCADIRIGGVVPDSVLANPFFAPANNRFQDGRVRTSEFVSADISVDPVKPTIVDHVSPSVLGAQQDMANESVTEVIRMAGANVNKDWMVGVTPEPTFILKGGSSLNAASSGGNASIFGATVPTSGENTLVLAENRESSVNGGNQMLLDVTNNMVASDVGPSMHFGEQIATKTDGIMMDVGGAGAENTLDIQGSMVQLNTLTNGGIVDNMGTNGVATNDMTMNAADAGIGNSMDIRGVRNVQINTITQEGGVDLLGTSRSAVDGGLLSGAIKQGGGIDLTRTDGAAVDGASVSGSTKFFGTNPIERTTPIANTNTERVATLTVNIGKDNTFNKMANTVSFGDKIALGNNDMPLDITNTFDSGSQSIPSTKTRGFSQAIVSDSATARDTPTGSITFDTGIAGSSSQSRDILFGDLASNEGIMNMTETVNSSVMSDQFSFGSLGITLDKTFKPVDGSSSMVQMSSGGSAGSTFPTTVRNVAGVVIVPNEKATSNTETINTPQDIVLDLNVKTSSVNNIDTGFGVLRDSATSFGQGFDTTLTSTGDTTTSSIPTDSFAANIDASKSFINNELNIITGTKPTTSFGQGFDITFVNKVKTTPSTLPTNSFGVGSDSSISFSENQLNSIGDASLTTGAGQGFDAISTKTADSTTSTATFNSFDVNKDASNSFATNEIKSASTQTLIVDPLIDTRPTDASFISNADVPGTTVRKQTVVLSSDLGNTNQMDNLIVYNKTTNINDNQLSGGQPNSLTDLPPINVNMNPNPTLISEIPIVTNKMIPDPTSDYRALSDPLINSDSTVHLASVNTLTKTSQPLSLGTFSLGEQNVTYISNDSMAFDNIILNDRVPTGVNIEKANTADINLAPIIRENVPINTVSTLGNAPDLNLNPIIVTKTETRATDARLNVDTNIPVPIDATVITDTRSRIPDIIIANDRAQSDRTIAFSSVDSASVGFPMDGTTDIQGLDRRPLITTGIILDAVEPTSASKLATVTNTRTISDGADFNIAVQPDNTNDASVTRTQVGGILNSQGSRTMLSQDQPVVSDLKPIVVANVKDTSKVSVDIKLPPITQPIIDLKDTVSAAMVPRVPDQGAINYEVSGGKIDSTTDISFMKDVQATKELMNRKFFSKTGPDGSVKDIRDGTAASTDIERQLRNVNLTNIPTQAVLETNVQVGTDGVLRPTFGQRQDRTTRFRNLNRSPDTTNVKSRDAERRRRVTTSTATRSSNGVRQDRQDQVRREQRTGAPIDPRTGMQISIRGITGRDINGRGQVSRNGPGMVRSGRQLRMDGRVGGVTDRRMGVSTNGMADRRMGVSSNGMRGAPVGGRPGTGPQPSMASGGRQMAPQMSMGPTGFRPPGVPPGAAVGPARPGPTFRPAAGLRTGDFGPPGFPPITGFPSSGFDTGALGAGPLVGGGTFPGFPVDSGGSDFISGRGFPFVGGGGFPFGGFPVGGTSPILTPALGTGTFDPFMGGTLTPTGFTGF